MEILDFSQLPKTEQNKFLKNYLIELKSNFRLMGIDLTRELENREFSEVKQRQLFLKDHNVYFKLTLTKIE